MPSGPNKFKQIGKPINPVFENAQQNDHVPRLLFGTPKNFEMNFETYNITGKHINPINIINKLSCINFGSYSRVTSETKIVHGNVIFIRRAENVLTYSGFNNFSFTPKKPAAIKKNNPAKFDITTKKSKCINFTSSI